MKGQTSKDKNSEKPSSFLAFIGKALVIWVKRNAGSKISAYLITIGILSWTVSSFAQLEAANFGIYCTTVLVIVFAMYMLQTRTKTPSRDNIIDIGPLNSDEFSAHTEKKKLSENRIAGVLNDGLDDFHASAMELGISRLADCERYIENKNNGDQRYNLNLNHSDSREQKLLRAQLLLAEIECKAFA